MGEKINWTARIVNANSAQLVLIIYELIFEAIDTAKQQLADNHKDEFRKTIERAKKLLMELVHDINFNNGLEYDIASLYLYVNKLFIQSYFKAEDKQLDEAKKILKKIYDGFTEAEKMLPKEEKEQKVVQNAQQIYAGMTYGRGILNESINIDRNRGFKA